MSIISQQRDQHTYKQKTKPKLVLSRPHILQQPGIKMTYKGFNIDVIRNYMEDCSSNPRDII